MIGQTISHYPALWESAPKLDSRMRNEILDNLRQKDARLPDGQDGEVGEVPNFPTSDMQRVDGSLSVVGGVV